MKRELKDQVINAIKGLKVIFGVSMKRGLKLYWRV